MGHIQVVALNVLGDDETLRKAIEVAAGVLDGSRTADTTRAIDAAPEATTALPPPARRAKKSDAKQFPCKHTGCAEVFESVGKLAAHSRAVHPKTQAASKPAESQPGQLWCPVKNCGRSFHKKGWLNGHLERDHGIKGGI